jgi:hypothetical protein
MRFHKHYTREQARKLLPQVRHWLKQLTDLRNALDKCDQRLAALMKPGCDLGGAVVNKWVRTMAEIKSVLLEFACREIQVKDLDRGLVDFPALLGQDEVFLCWEHGEDDIEFWHHLDAGYAGRERLPPADPGEE